MVKTREEWTEKLKEFKIAKAKVSARGRLGYRGQSGLVQIVELKRLMAAEEKAAEEKKVTEERAAEDQNDEEEGASEERVIEEDEEEAAPDERVVEDAGVKATAECSW